MKSAKKQRGTRPTEPVKPEAIDVVIQRLESKSELGPLILGGTSFFAIDMPLKIKQEQIEKLATLMQANLILKEVTLHNFSLASRSSLELNAFFSNKILAALQASPIEALSIDFLAIQALLKNLAHFKRLQKLSIVCKANELKYFVDHWKSTPLPPFFSKLSLNISNFFSTDLSDRTMVDIAAISDYVCDLIANTSPLKALELKFDTSIDLGFFEKLALVLAETKHSLQTITFDSPVDENAVTKIIEILDKNLTLQIIFLKGKEDYRLLYGVIEVINARNGRNRDPVLSKSAAIALEEQVSFSNNDGLLMVPLPEATNDTFALKEEKHADNIRLHKRKLSGEGGSSNKEQTVDPSNPSIATSIHGFLSPKAHVLNDVTTLSFSLRM